jgi:hypothetical protein
LLALGFSPATTLHAHSDAGFRLADLRIYQAWKSGPSDAGPGPHLLSVNEYRPHRLSDVVPIARVSAVLVRQVVANSLSVWKSEEALRKFTISPLHRRVMREYRDRGYLRHIHWWGEHTTIGAGMAEARRRLDAGEGRRVGDATDGWARRDQLRLAEAAASR